MRQESWETVVGLLAAGSLLNLLLVRSLLSHTASSLLRFFFESDLLLLLLTLLREIFLTLLLKGRFLD